jgi:hypothetical protein
MAGQLLVLNPRRKRRKKARATTKRRRVRRARARVHNPHRRTRRRVRRIGARRRRRVVRHNPGGRLMGVNLGQVAMIAGGGIAVEILADKLAAMLPASWKADANLVRIGTKAAVGIGAPMLLRRFLPRGWGSAIALGGGIVTVLDIFKTYIAPKIGVTLSSYEIGPYPGMSGYEQLSGFNDDNDGSGAYGGSIYG